MSDSEISEQQRFEASNEGTEGVTLQGAASVTTDSSSSSTSEEEDVPAQQVKVLDNSDVKFMVQGTQVHACRSVLSLLSPVFESMFKSDFKEREQDEIELPGKSAKGMIHLIQVTHTREEITVDNVYDLLPLCHEYQMEQLKAECEAFLLRETSLLNCNVTTEPLLQRYVLYADIYELTNLKDACVHKLSKIPFKCIKSSDVYGLLSSDIKMAILTAKATENDKNEKLVRNIRAVYQGRRDQKKYWNRHERKHCGLCDITENGLHAQGSRSTNCSLCASYRYHLIASTIKRSSF